MRLFLAEKKSLGEAIAAGIGNGKPGTGCITCGDDVVSWCAGHLLQEFLPEDYDEKYQHWSMDDLPIIPDEWHSKPKDKAGYQLGILRELLKKADSVVNCGDPDREGQVLVDEVLEHFGYRGPVQRLWLDDGLTPQAVRKALGKMRDNQDFAPLRDAARARSRADWLVGLNSSRAMTLKAREAGLQGSLPIGRVKTPTLALVVMRDMAIDAFKPYPFYVLKAQCTHENGAFTVTYKPTENAEGLDAEGRLVDKARAESLRQSVSGQSGSVVLATAEEKQTQPPLAYSLSALSKVASAKYGMTAKQVLDAAQALYLAKLTSYPRTNCGYLPEDQQAEGATILASLATFSGLFAHVAAIAAKADATLKSPAWNSAKLTAHHGIIPTGEVPSSALSEHQAKIFGLICENYALQFHPPMRYEARAIEVQFGDTLWKVTGKRILEPGWTAFSSGEEENERAAVDSLPAVQEGDTVVCADVAVSEKMTTPPASFTDGTLLDAMENVHRYVCVSAKHKDTLRKTKGIGTDATRAMIVDELLKNGLLAMDGKKILSTPLGRQVIELVPAELKDPLTTAEWESRLEDVAEGKLSLDEFIAAVKEDVPRLLGCIRSLVIDRLAGTYPCPECGQPLRRGKQKEGTGYYWICRNEAGHASGKPVFMDDKGGKPVPRAVHPCPVCGKPLRRSKSQKDGKIRWICFEEAAHPDKKPVFLDDKNGKPAKMYLCPECGKPLARKAKGDGYYWGCWNSENHASGKPFFASDKSGKPDFGGKKK